MTNQTPESVIAEVIEYYADTIGSHWDGCHKHHAVCLAVKLRDMLREPGEPGEPGEQNDDRDRPTIGLARVISAWDQGKQTTRRIPHWAVGLAAHLIDSGHAVDRATVPDAATAAIERVRAIHVRDEYGLCAECSWEYPETSYDAISNDVAWPCPTVAALDGAPEPEWEYGYRGRYAVMHPTKAGQRIETPEITQRTPDNWLPEMGEIYRRRPSTPAGLWLPVEGESDD